MSDHTKAEAIERAAAGLGALAKAAEDEPIFVLRAKDRLAPITVQRWCDDMERLVAENPHEYPMATSDKIADARNCVTAMLAWQAANGSKVAD